MQTSQYPEAENPGRAGENAVYWGQLGDRRGNTALESWLLIHAYQKHQN